MKENKKIVDAVSKTVIRGVKEMESLKAQTLSVVNSLKKEWENSEPKRKKVQAHANRIIGNVEKKSTGIINKSLQLKKDITKGVKLGLKIARKNLKHKYEFLQTIYRYPSSVACGGGVVCYFSSKYTL